MPKTVFWDVDTQYDFMMDDGKLYVPNAMAIIPNLAQITKYARENGIQIMGSVDEHTQSDAELSDKPDFHETFPPHCMKGTKGQAKIEATKPENPLWIESKKQTKAQLEAKIKKHTGEIIFKKQRFDVFSNPNVDDVLEIVSPEHIVVYGVALDVCDAHAIEGFLAPKKYKLTLIEDATKPIYEDKGKELIAKWKSQGVRVVKTEDVVRGKI